MNRLIKTKDLFRDADRIDNTIRCERGDLICSKAGIAANPLSDSDRAYVEGLKRIRNSPMDMNPSLQASVPTTIKFPSGAAIICGLYTGGAPYIGSPYNFKRDAESLSDCDSIKSKET